MAILDISKLPPVTTTIALCLWVIYMIQEVLLDVFDPDDIQISWDIIMKDGEWWRLLYAHYFHFNRVHIFINCIALVGVGNSLEIKIKWWSLSLIILSYGIFTNIMYVGITRFFCTDYEQHQFSFGFSWVVFALRVLNVLVVGDPQVRRNSTGGRVPGDGEETWVYGFYPVILPSWLNVWWPLVESVFFDHVILEKCIIGNISGILVALTIPFLNFGGIKNKIREHED